MHPIPISKNGRRHVPQLPFGSHVRHCSIVVVCPLRPCLCPPIPSWHVARVGILFQSRRKRKTRTLHAISTLPSRQSFANTDIKIQTKCLLLLLTLQKPCGGMPHLDPVSPQKRFDSRAQNSSFPMVPAGAIVLMLSRTNKETWFGGKRASKMT